LAVTYTTHANVTAMLGISTRSASTTPTDTTVETFINRAEDYIDQRLGHAFRSITVTDELHDLKIPYKPRLGVPVYLNHRKITTFSSGAGDVVGVWEGSTFENWLDTKTEGRADDFFVDYDKGIIYFRYTFPIYREASVKITYRYGESSVPKDIEDAATKLAAIDVMMQDDRSWLIPEGANSINIPGKIEEFKKDVERILQARAELKVVTQ